MVYPVAKTFVITRRPPPAKIMYTEYREEVRKDLNKVRDAHIKSRERIVANWSERSKPKFIGKTIVTVGRIAIQVIVREVDRTRPLWHWISKTGTRPHIIKPKKSDGVLAFIWGGRGSYQPKTGAGPGRFGGPGQVRGGVLRFFKQVKHTGFRPRQFDERINKDLESDFKKGLRNGGRRGLRKAKRNR